MKISLSFSDPDIQVTGENNWMVDLTPHHPQHFSTTIIFPSREGYFQVMAGALDTQRGKMFQDGVLVRITAQGATLNPTSSSTPGIPEPATSPPITLDPYLLGFRLRQNHSAMPKLSAH